MSLSISLRIFLGILSTMVSNGFYLSTSYIVKNKNDAAGEIILFSSAFYILVFGIWSAKVKFSQMFNEEQGSNYDSKAWLSLIISNLAIAVTILMSYVAVTLLPLSDFIVFEFTCPVFTLLLVMVNNR